LKHTNTFYKTALNTTIKCKVEFSIKSDKYLKYAYLITIVNNELSEYLQAAVRCTVCHANSTVSSKEE